MSELRIEYPKNVTFEDPFEDNFDDDPLNADEANALDRQVLKLPNGIVIKKRKVWRILRYVNYNVKRDPENHYRERLMLFCHGEMRNRISMEVIKHMRNIT